MSKQDILELMMAGMDKQGILSKVRAQIKASVYKIMDQQADKKGGASHFFWENQKGTELQKNKQCVLLLELIKEFLQFYDFDYTLSVFSSECNMREAVKREQLIDKIGINKKDVESQKPVLLHVFTQYSSGAKVSLKPTEKADKAEPKSQPIKPGKTTPQVAVEAKKPSTAPSQMTKTENKFNAPQTQNQNIKKNTYHGFEEIDDEEPINEDLYESSLPKQSKPKENPMFTSSEDFLASQSQGFDITVDSMELEQYDHIEDIYHKK